MRRRTEACPARRHNRSTPITARHIQRLRADRTFDMTASRIAFKEVVFSTALIAAAVTVVPAAVSTLVI